MQRMPDDILELFIRQYIESWDCPEITFAWQGGEPTLMGLDFFRKAVRLEQKYAPAGKRILNTLQTNGLLIDDQWCSFLRDHGFLIGISIDGPKGLHDAYRKDLGGRPTFDRVMRSIELLGHYGLEYNTLTVVNRINARYPLEVYRFQRDEADSRYMQFIPCVEAAGFEHTAPRQPAAAADVTGWSVVPDDYGDFLVGIFDEWLLHDVGDVFVILFDVMLGLWMGLPASACTFAPVCGTALALENDGSIYSCDHYVYPEFRLGNIADTPLREILSSDRQRRFGMAKAGALPGSCRECSFLFACRGECPKNRIRTTASGEPGLNYLCAGFKKFFTHIDPWMKLMAAELRAGRTADRVMEYARAKGQRQ
jgi:uncharacterized protein